MSDSKNRSRITVLAASGVLLLFAGALVVRVLDREGRSAPSNLTRAKLPRHVGPAPAARVPGPRPVDVAHLKVPCWGCVPESDEWSVRFQTDLDLLAPLGDGPGNAALWLKDFTARVGAREAEAEAALKRRITASGGQRVLPPGDPLLSEAEPWCDQAAMRFYPDVFPMEGFATSIPNLQVAVTLARSWVARGIASPDASTALDDCRRAIRLGRLLRQEDATVISDLIGLSCIRAGAQGLYDLAVRRGDAAEALAAAIVLGEHAPQRLRTAQVITKVSVQPSDPSRWPWSLGLGDRRLEDVIEVARGSGDRRFRAEATLQLGVVEVAGTRTQKGRARTVLERIAAGRDPFLASAARWCLDHRDARSLLEPAM